MSIQITNTSTHLIINNDGNIRNINKLLVREVSVLRDTTLKIDIGGGALRNIFLPISDITLPVFVDNKSMIDDINRLLTPPEIAITDNLQSLSSTISDIENKVSNILPASMQEPIFVDESNPNVVYTGFASTGANTSESQWAIMRTSIQDDIVSNQWSNGKQTMDAIWDKRAELTYA